MTLNQGRLVHIHWAKQKRRFYNNNLNIFTIFFCSSEKCKALYSVNCILVSIVNFIHLFCVEVVKSWICYAESDLWARRSQRDVANLSWPIAPSSMCPNWGGGGGNDTVCHSCFPWWQSVVYIYIYLNTSRWNCQKLAAEQPLPGAGGIERPCMTIQINHTCRAATLLQLSWQDADPGQPSSIRPHWWWCFAGKKHSI